MQEYPRSSGRKPLDWPRLMTQELKRLARKLLAVGLYSSGLLWAYAALRLRRRAVVLTYHRVLPASADSYSAPGIRVLPETFARHMRFLRRHFNVMSVDELAAHLEGRKLLPSWTCIVTFDDGWHDNDAYALPILSREDIPATIFVAANFVGSDEGFWQERIARRMHRAFASGGQLRSFIAERAGVETATSDPERLRSALRSEVTRMKSLPPDQVEAFEGDLTRMMREAGVAEEPAGDDRFMSWPQLARLYRQTPVTIGAHGCSHRPLTALPEEDVALELAECREKIAASAGISPTAIAYPDGRANAAVASLARSAGFRVGFTTEPGLIATGDDPHLLMRVNMHESSSATIPEFLCTLLGIFRRAGSATRNARTGH